MASEHWSPQVLTEQVGAQGAVGCSWRVGSVRQAYQRPVWTALEKGDLSEDEGVHRRPIDCRRLS